MSATPAAMSEAMRRELLWSSRSGANEFRRRRLSLQPSGPAKEIVEPPRANAPPKNPQKGSDGSTEEDGEQRANAGGTSTIP